MPAPCARSCCRLGASLIANGTAGVRLGLQEIDPRLVNVVNYRYFAGYSEAETADLLEVSKRTVRRDWFKAKAWLAEKLNAHDITQAPQI